MKYHVPHITISPFNSQGDGLVERRHQDVRKAIMKVVEVDKTKWWKAFPLVFWTEHITIQKMTGYLPYFLAHGVEPVLPFDIVEATYLAPTFTAPMSSA